MNSHTILMFVLIGGGLLYCAGPYTKRAPKLRDETPRTGRAFYIVEEFEPGKFCLAWDRGFGTANAARLKAFAMKKERHFANLTLKVGYWTGTEWEAFYETV